MEIKEDEELLQDEDDYSPNIVPMHGHDSMGNVIYNIADVSSDSEFDELDKLEHEGEDEENESDSDSEGPLDKK